jgi:hypothetical protein
MTLGKKQELFALLLAQLIVYANTMGYKVRLGEVLRSKEQAKRNAAAGIGIANSNHIRAIAADIALMKNGKYLTRTSQYKLLGDFWESLHPLCSWGGDFDDGGHFSITHNGVR